MTALLIAFCFAVWTAIAPGLEHAGDARDIAVAISQAVLDDAANAPALTSHTEDAAALAFLAFRESSLRADIEGDCEDPAAPSPELRRCRAHGPWQLHGDCGRRSLVDQARCELALLHAGAARCPEHPTAMLWGQCTGLVPAPTKGAPKRRDDVARMAGRREGKIRELTRQVLAR